jgi:hypothetical protein
MSGEIFFLRSGNSQKIELGVRREEKKEEPSMFSGTLMTKCVWAEKGGGRGTHVCNV